MNRDKDAMQYNTAEKEVIGLCISLEAVKDMLNHALFELRDVSVYPREVEVIFHSHIHEELFIIRFLDFVKETGDSKLTGVSGSCLKVLQSVCDSPSLYQDNNINSLKKSVLELYEWLNYKTPIKLWLPTLDIEADIEVSRLDLIEISGNHCKHNLSRLTAVSKQIYLILYKSGYSVSIEQIPLALDDFRAHLQNNYFIYYATYLSEMFNNIHWGIQDYLQPTYKASYKKDDPNDIRYRYEYPAKITHEIPRQWFWRLMNNIRTGPIFKKFTCAQYLKKKCSLEWRDK